MKRYYEFKVELLGITPKIWRRFLLKNTLTFKSLHDAIQDACGWGNCHLFEFTSGEGYDSTVAVSPFALSDTEAEYGPPEAGQLRLKSYFKDNTHCFYIYDFGDSWRHKVTKIAEREWDSKTRRRLLDGSRAFPLEDSGGFPGYEECIKAFWEVGSDDEELRCRKQWIGDWNPDFFDLIGTKRHFDL